MTRTRITQSILIYASDTYDDTITPSLANFETNPLNAEEDLNNIRSMLSHLRDVQTGNWHDVLVAPTALETGTARGVQNVNDALHALEKKRVLRCVWSLESIAGGAAQGVILALSEIPANTTIAVGAVTTLGTVAEDATTFGTFSAADVVSGPTAISPLNLVQLVDATTRDPILDGADRVYGLLQSENAADGHTATGTTPNRLQISFVKISGGTSLTLVTAGALNGTNFDYCYVERVRLEDLNEADFLGGANIDVPSGTTVTRQVAYDNQGATPVDQTTNAILDLEGPGLAWLVRDDLEAVLLGITEGSAGGTSVLQVGAAVDTFDVDAIVNDFASGMRIDTGGERIDIGENAGVIESTGANDLTVNGNGELLLEDGNRSGSTYAQVGIKLSETTAEWDAFEVEFGGEVSLLNAIVAASNSASRTRVQAVVTANIAADTDVGGPGGTVTNLDVNLPAYDAVTFLTDVDVFVDGVLMRNGANAAANEDVYPGTDQSLGDLRFEFALKGTGSKPDVVTVIVYGQ